MNLSVPTTAGGAALVAADPDQWRTVIVQNLGPTNYIALEIGAPPTTAGGLQVVSGATSPPIPLPPGNALNAIANTGACDVRYLVS